MRNIEDFAAFGEIMVLIFSFKSIPFFVLLFVFCVIKFCLLGWLFDFCCFLFCFCFCFFWGGELFPTVLSHNLLATLIWILEFFKVLFLPFSYRFPIIQNNFSRIFWVHHSNISSLIAVSYFSTMFWYFWVLEQRMAISASKRGNTRFVLISISFWEGICFFVLFCFLFCLGGGVL